MYIRVFFLLETEKAPGRRHRRSDLFQFRVEHQNGKHAGARCQNVRRVFPETPANSVMEMGKRHHRQPARKRVHRQMVSATIHIG